MVGRTGGGSSFSGAGINRAVIDAAGGKMGKRADRAASRNRPATTSRLSGLPSGVSQATNRQNMRMPKIISAIARMTAAITRRASPAANMTVLPRRNQKHQDRAGLMLLITVDQSS